MSHLPACVCWLCVCVILCVCCVILDYLDSECVCIDALVLCITPSSKIQQTLNKLLPSKHYIKHGIPRMLKLIIFLLMIFDLYTLVDDNVLPTLQCSVLMEQVILLSETVRDWTLYKIRWFGVKYSHYLWWSNLHARHKDFISWAVHPYSCHNSISFIILIPLIHAIWTNYFLDNFLSHFYYSINVALADCKLTVEEWWPNGQLFLGIY